MYMYASVQRRSQKKTVEICIEFDQILIQFISINSKKLMGRVEFIKPPKYVHAPIRFKGKYM